MTKEQVTTASCAFFLVVSNELCRAVVVIGIPYPNANSIELKERIKYAESSSGGKREAGLMLCACFIYVYGRRQM